MQVFSVLQRIDYQGDTLLAVFGTRDGALQFVRSHPDFQCGMGLALGIVESTLGQMCSWEDFEEVVN